MIKHILEDNESHFAIDCEICDAFLFSNGPMCNDIQAIL